MPRQSTCFPGLRRLFCFAACLAAAFLAGCGSTATSPRLTVGTAALVFSSQLAGTPSDAQMVQLSNPGNAPLSIASIVLAGTNPDVFAQTNTCGSSLAANGTCTIAVRFTPSAQGSFNATLVISASGSVGSRAVSLSGAGIAPQATFSPAQLTFASTDSGYTALPQTVQLTNSGSAPLALGTLSLTGAAFAQTNNCDQSLAPQASCTLTITFTPPSAGNFSGTLALTGAGSQTLLLSGAGTPDTPLSQWHNALLHCRTEPVNLVILGDSRTIVDNTIAAGGAGVVDTFGSKWADLLAAALQSSCGSHGTGLVPFLPLAQNHLLNNDFYQSTGDWTNYAAFGPYQGNAVPAALGLMTASPFFITFNAGQPFDTLQVYCEAGPGLNAWTMQVDGAAVGTCGGTSSAEQPVRGQSSQLAFGQHTATLICAQSPCVAYGMEAVAGTTGVSVHNLAIASCTAECFGLNPPTQLAYSDLIPKHDLLILDILTNEPGVGYSVDSFQASMNRIIQHEHALPRAPSVLVVAPLQDLVNYLPPYYGSLPGIAAANNAAFVDVRATYGYDFMPQYFGPDSIHENNAGHLATFSVIKPVVLP